LRHLLTAPVIVLFLSCSVSSDSSSIVDESPPLFGSWNWVESSGGIAGMVETPSTTGHTRSLQFEKNGIYRQYTDSLLSISSTFSVKKDRTIFSQDSLPCLVIAEQPAHTILPQAILKLTTDSLLLAENVYDGFSHLCLRKK
jgi:hypothetical protein